MIPADIGHAALRLEVQLLIIAVTATSIITTKNIFFIISD